MSRRFLLMLLCCAVPLALIWALPYVGVTRSTAIVLLAVIALCPLLHLVLMCRLGSHRDGDTQRGQRGADALRRPAVPGPGPRAISAEGHAERGGA